MKKDCETWAKECLECQRNKISRHTVSPWKSFPADSERFHHVHIDLVGPLPSVEGYKYLLTCIDRYTRWPEAEPLMDMTAETVARAFFRIWISRYGAPAIITSDQGRQFEASLFAELLKICGIHRQRTSAYHPQANGMIESFHRPLKVALRCHPQVPWTEALPVVLLGLRAAFKEDQGASPAEFVYGTQLRLPGDFFNSKTDEKRNYSQVLNNLKQIMTALKPKTTIWHSSPTTFINQDLKTCSHVFVRVDATRRPLQAPYIGPCKIIKREEKTYLVEVKGAQRNISVDRLKPAYLISEISESASAAPLRRRAVTFSDSVTPEGESCGAACGAALRRCEN